MLRTRITILLSFAILTAAVPATAQTYLVSGTVRDPDLLPVDNVAVQMYTTNGVPIGVYLDTTDVTGFYSIAGVDPGSYDISFRPRKSTGLVPVYMAGITVNSNLTLNVNLELGNYLSGFVYDSQGEGILDVDLNVYDQQTGNQLFTPSDNTDDTGFYEIVIPSGTFTIDYRYRGDIPNPRYVPVEMTDVVVNSDTEVDVVLEDGFFISGAVRDPGNGPVVDADLDARDSITGLKLYTPGDNTDNNGDYVLLVPPGTYEINVAPLPPDHLLPGIVYDYPVFGDVTLNFNLDWGLLLYGVVRDSDGAGVFDVDLDVWDPVTGQALFTPWDNTIEDGSYQIVVPPGTYNVDFRPAVRPPYLACYREHNFNIASDAQLDAVVPDGVLLYGSAHNSFGAAVRDVDIDAIDVSTDESVALFDDNTDSLGAYATIVAPGTYHLEYEPPRARRLAAQRFADQILNVDTERSVVLDTGMVVSGTVTEQGVGPVADVRVTAVASSTQQEAFTPGNKSDLNGFYEILVEPNTYDLTYSPDSMSGIPDTISFLNVPVSRDTTIDVVLGSAPVADFVGSPRNGVPPMLVTFSDLSDYNPTSWSWDFGDGGTSFEQNPTHLYESLGYFTVSLTASNDHGSDIEVKTNYIFLSEEGGCGPYVVGDYNGSGALNVADIVDAYSKLKTGSPDAFLLCECPQGSGNVWAVAMDVNSSCTMNIADVVAAFSFLKTGAPELFPCDLCPPGSP